MYYKTFLFRSDAEAFALHEGERLDAHAIIGQHFVTGLWHVALVEA
jgi:hypothetical protein